MLWMDPQNCSQNDRILLSNVGTLMPLLLIIPLWDSSCNSFLIFKELSKMYAALTKSCTHTLHMSLLEVIFRGLEAQDEVYTEMLNTKSCLSSAALLCFHYSTVIIDEAIMMSLELWTSNCLARSCVLGWSVTHSSSSRHEKFLSFFSRKYGKGITLCVQSTHTTVN